MGVVLALSSFPSNYIYYDMSFSLFSVSLKHGEVIALMQAKVSVYALCFSPTLIPQCFIEFVLSAYSFSLKIFLSLSLFPMLVSRFWVITSAGSRTLRHSSVRLSISPVILMINIFSM